jgi:hypothetical protein
LAKDPTSCSAGKSVFCFSKAAFDVGTSQSSQSFDLDSHYMN